MSKVSVIVPVYNMAGKLDRCLKSLAQQTLKDIEFILINDASTDNSLDYLLEFEKSHSDNTIIVNCEINQGAGGARNAGLEYASGEYIGFIDSDDYIKPEMFEKLYSKAVSGDYDVVDSDVLLAKDDSVSRGIDEVFCDRELSSSERELMLLSDGYIVSKLFKRALIEKNGIRFREKVKLEDADFLLKAMLKAQRIGAVREVFYVYDNTASGGTWSVNKASESEYYQILEVMKSFIDILNQDEDAKCCRTAIEGAILNHYRAALYCCLSEDGQLSGENLQRILSVRDICRNNITGGIDNKYFIQVASEDDLELMHFLDTVNI